MGNSPVTGEFPIQRPVTRSFDVFFDLRLNKRLSKQWWGWWLETPSRPSWRYCNVMPRINILSISYKTALEWIPKDIADASSTLVQVVVRQQAITWTTVDQVLWRHLALGAVTNVRHSELVQWDRSNWWPMFCIWHFHMRSQEWKHCIQISSCPLGNKPSLFRMMPWCQTMMHTMGHLAMGLLPDT